MIGDSLFEVLLVRSAVLGLRAITPACFIYLTVLAAIRIFGTVAISIPLQILAYYAVAECIFFVGIFVPLKRRVDRLASTPPPLTRLEREELMSRCLTAVDDPEDFIRGWFYGSPFELIKRENIREWLTCSFLCSESVDEEDLRSWKEESDQYISALETRFNWKIPPGKTEDLPLMRLHLDPVNVVSRPLLWYMIVGIIDVVTHIGLSFAGLKYYSSSRWLETYPIRPHTLLSRRSPKSNLTYWYRPHRSSDKLPIVLIHGIGIGLFAYIKLARDIIRADNDVGLIVVEVLPISMRLMSTTRSESLPDNFCDNLLAILSHHCVDTFNLIGHSYGTFLSAHILHHADLGHRVRSLVLLDPITFLLFHPFLVYNFVYRRPGPWRANEWMIWYFTSRDIGIAALLARQFFWSDGVLWKDDPVLKNENRETLIVLGGSDQIISTPRVWRYLTGSALSEEESEGVNIAGVEWENDDRSMRVIMYPTLDHAQILMSSSKYAPVIEHVLRAKPVETSDSQLIS